MHIKQWFRNQISVIADINKPSAYKARKNTLRPRLDNRALFLDERTTLEKKLKKFFKKNSKPTPEQIDKVLSSIWKIPNSWKAKSLQNQIPLIRQQIRRINDAFDIFRRLDIKDSQIQSDFIKTLFIGFYIPLIDPSRSRKTTEEDDIDFVKKTGFIVNPTITTFLKGSDILPAGRFFIPVAMHNEAITEKRDRDTLQQFLTPLIGSFDMKIPPVIECNFPNEIYGASSHRTFLIFNNYFTRAASIDQQKEGIEKITDPKLKESLLDELKNYRIILLQHELVHYFLEKALKVNLSDKVDFKILFPTIGTNMQASVDSKQIALEIIAQTMNIVTAPHLSIMNVFKSSPKYLGPSATIIWHYLELAFKTKGLVLNLNDISSFGNSNIDLVKSIREKLGSKVYNDFVDNVINAFYSASKQLVTQLRAN